MIDRLSIYTPAQVALIWGCPTPSVNRMIRDGRLPAIRIGGRHYRIKREHVDGCDSFAEARLRHSEVEMMNVISDNAESVAAAMRRQIAEHPVDGFIYFIQCQEIVKIGYSRAPAVRWKKLQAVIPFELLLLGTVPGCVPSEKALHRYLAPIKYPVFDEWFNMSETLMAAIRLVTESSEVAGNG